MARVIALLAVIFGLLVGGSPTSAIEPPTDVSLMASAYHAAIYERATSYTAHERGPPARTYDNTAMGAVDSSEREIEDAELRAWLVVLP